MAAEKNKNIAINAQYIKDLSFESPQAPNSLMGDKPRPTIDISIDVKASATGTEDIYECVLNINATAKREDHAVFVTELSYAGIFTLQNIPDNEKEPALLIFCPNLLFPFARRVIADTTRDGGFPPHRLDPNDFGALYAQRAQAAQQAKEETQQ